jgi:cytochrome c
MKKSVLIMVILLAIVPVYLSSQLLAQEKMGSSETKMAKLDTSKVKAETKKDDMAMPAMKDSTKAGEKSSHKSDDKGIGPIKELKLGPIDTSMVSKGQALFQSQCVTCHQLDKKKIGPPLRNVTDQMTPEFIMNMILNTDIMEKKDPEVKKLISEYGTYMSVLDIKPDQARQLLEYLRWAGKQPADKK